MGVSGTSPFEPLVDVDVDAASPVPDGRRHHRHLGGVLVARCRRRLELVLERGGDPVALLLAQRVLEQRGLLGCVVGQLDALVGHQARHEDVAPPRHQLEQAVADVLHAGGQAARQEQQDDQEPEAREDQLVLRERVAQHLDQRHAHEDAADGAQPADDRHGEHDQPVGRVERVEADRTQQDGVQATRHAGDGAREHEARQLGAYRRHRHGGRRLLVVTRRQQDAARAGLAQPLNEQDRQRQEPETGEVVGLVRHQVEALPQHRAQELLRNDVREVRRVQEEGVDRHAQREGDRGQIGAADAQRGNADDHRQHRPGRSCGRQAQEEVDVGLLDHVPGDHPPDAGERELAEAHVARPPGQDDERDGDDPVDQGRRVLERGPRTGHERHHDHDDAEQEEDADPAGDHLGQLAQRVGDRLQNSGRRERLLGVVRPAPLLLQEEQADEDRHQVHHVADGAAVARHVELEEARRDAQGDAGAEGQRQVLHAGDDRRRQRGQDERRPRARRDRDAARRRARECSSVRRAGRR